MIASEIQVMSHKTQKENIELSNDCVQEEAKIIKEKINYDFFKAELAQFEQKESILPSQDLLDYMIINKLCFDNKMFLINYSQLEFKFNNQEQIYQYQATDEGEQIVEYEEDLDKPFTFGPFFKFHQNQNITTLFFQLVIYFLVQYVLLGPFFFIVSIVKKTNKNFGEFLFSLFGLISSAFFYTYVAYMVLNTTDKEEINIKFYGINALTFIAILYYSILMSGKTITQFYFQYFQKQLTKQALEDLEIPSDQMYFETMDRQSIKQIMSFSNQNSIYKYIKAKLNNNISDNLQFMANTSQNQQQLVAKVWNSGFILVLYDQQKSSTTSLDVIQAILFIILALGYLVAHIVLPFVYLIDLAEDSFSKWNFAILVLALFFYAVLTLFFCVFSSMLSDKFIKMETLTSLIEVKSYMGNDYQFQKNVTTINLYCIQSIKTWFYVRTLVISVIQQFLQFVNITQVIDVICFLSLGSILAMDFLGIGWTRYQIIDNKLLFGLILTNFLMRLLLQIYPIFITFSSVNNILSSHKEQIHSIYSKLTYLRANYRILRSNFRFQINKLCPEFQNILNTNGNDSQNYLRKLIDTSFFSQMLHKERSSHQIEQLRAIYEIIRNTELYSTQSNSYDNENSYRSQSESEKITREIEYLSQLIKTYKLINQDLNMKEEKNQLKFMGILPISYAKAQAVLILAIPAVFSLIIQRFQ